MDYVLNSDGIWSIFGEKLLIAFVALVAFIATINGKIGINTQWMHDYFIVLDLTELNNLTTKIAKWIAILLVLLGLFIAGKALVENHDKIKDYFVDRVDYFMSSKTQYNVNSIARKYLKKGSYETNINTTMHNGNVFLCENKDETIRYIFTKSLKVDAFVDATHEQGVILSYHDTNMYLGKYKNGEKILTILDDNKALLADTNKTLELSCYEHQKANI